MRCSVLDTHTHCTLGMTYIVSGGALNSTHSLTAHTHIMIRSCDTGFWWTYTRCGCHNVSSTSCVCWCTAAWTEQHRDTCLT